MAALTLDLPCIWCVISLSAEALSSRAHVCCCGADDPWLILHKLDSPSKMRYIGSRFGACRNATSATVIPGSIAEWVSQTGRQRSHLSSGTNLCPFLHCCANALGATFSKMPAWVCTELVCRCTVQKAKSAWAMQMNRGCGMTGRLSAAPEAADLRQGCSRRARMAQPL